MRFYFRKILTVYFFNLFCYNCFVKPVNSGGVQMADKVFGEKKDVQYTDRVGAYLLYVKNGKLAVIKTGKGYFLPGGGIEGNETHQECIIRECLEETGISADVGEYICSAESFLYHEKIGYFHPIQYYYAGEFPEKVSEPSETDHKLVWIDAELAKEKMKVEQQRWAVKKYLTGLN